MTPRPVRTAKDQTSYEHVEWAKQEASSAIWSLYGGQTTARRGAAARALLSLWGNYPIITRNHPGNYPVGPYGVITPWGDSHPRHGAAVNLPLARTGGNQHGGMKNRCL